VTDAPSTRPTYSWRVIENGVRVGSGPVAVEVTGDSLHITPSGALVIAGPLPKTTVLRAWAVGEWLSVEKVV
jgi:hypothetical protein